MSAPVLPSAATAPLALLVVDDEALARLRLRQLVAACTGVAAEVRAEAGDATAALACLRQQRFDAVLLDIGLPGSSGLALAATLRGLPEPPAVVFVTAHASHALQAFELQALDYLTKPVRLDRLRDALSRVQQRRAAAVPAPPAAEAPVLMVRERDRVLRLPHAEIVSLRAEHKVVLVRTAQHSYVVDDSLNDLEQRLGPAFVRVHRNALVALGAIRALELRPGGDEDAGGDGWAVQLAVSGEWLAVSRRQLPVVKAALGANLAPP